MGKTRNTGKLATQIQFDNSNNLVIGNSTSSSFNTSGSVNAIGGITGSIFGIGDPTSFSASISSNLVSIQSVTTSNIARLSNLETKSSSVDISVSSLNTFSASNGNTSLNLKTGSYATTGSNTFFGTQTYSGSVYIANDLIVQGSSSIQYISASSVSIGTNIVQLNTANPSVRFAGLTIIDSGSIGGSGSFLYDSVQDEFIFVHRGNGTNVTSSHFVLGPETYDSLGNETYLTSNIIPKGTGKEHLIDSCIFDNGTTTCIKNNLVGTGTINSVGLLTGQASIYQADAGGLIASNRWGVYNGGATAMSFFYNASGNVVWDNGSPRMVLTNTGDLGIGVSTPQSIFHIIKALGSDVIKIGESGTGTRFAIGQEAGYTGNYINSRNIDLKLQAYCAGGSGGNIHFQTGTDGSGCVTSKMFICSTGRVGIGTTTPSHTLDVNGTINASTLISLTRKYETNAVSFSTQAGATDTFNIDIAGLSGLAVAGNYQTADVYFQAGLYPGATTINGRIGVVGRNGVNTANLYAITCIGGLGVVTITPYGNGSSTFGLCLQSNCTSSFVYWKAIVNTMSV